MNVKAETSNSAAGIKREGEENKSDRDFKRPRNLGPNVVDLTGGVIDLTED